MKRSYLKGYEVKLSEDAIVELTVMYHLTNEKHDLTVIYDEWGREIARERTPHSDERNAFAGVLKRAYENLEKRYLQVQKEVYKAMKEPLPEIETLKKEFKFTADGREMLTMIAGVENGTV